MADGVCMDETLVWDGTEPLGLVGSFGDTYPIKRSPRCVMRLCIAPNAEQKAHTVTPTSNVGDRIRRPCEAEELSIDQIQTTSITFLFLPCDNPQPWLYLLLRLEN